MGKSAKQSKPSEQSFTKTKKITRPTKKQHELLAFLQEFIDKHGYSPSYREIMRGCNYTSVATVALHVDNLITRGHIKKRNKSARSLEVIANVTSKDVSRMSKTEYSHELIHQIESRFKKVENNIEEEALNELYVLVGALKILGHVDASRAYASRINQLTQ